MAMSPLIAARRAWFGCLALGCIAAEPPALINPNDPALAWRSYIVRNDTCVLAATALSERRDDAFDVEFKRARGQTLRLYVTIPKLPGGGMLFIESPTTRDRWRISTDHYTPVLEGARAEAIHRNAISGIPIAFTFEYPARKPVIYQTVPARAVDAAAAFAKCIEYVERPLEAESSP